MTKPNDKMAEGLSTFMEGFVALVEEASDNEVSEELEEELSPEAEAEIANEVRIALESLIDNDDYSTEEIAAAMNALTEGLQEIDPDIFESEDDDDDDFDDDDEDNDDDDDDLMFDEDLDSLDDIDEDVDFDDDLDS